MGGGPLDLSDYSQGYSVVRTGDSHRHEVGTKDGYWRKEVEAEILRHVAEKHSARALYAVGDEGGLGQLPYLQEIDTFDLIRYATGNHDNFDPEHIAGAKGIISDELMEWEIHDGERKYNIAMAHNPDMFNLGLSDMPRTVEETENGKKKVWVKNMTREDGELYNLVIMGHCHFPDEYRLNPVTVADHAGSLYRIYRNEHREMGREFAPDRLWHHFPTPLQEEVSYPERSFSVLKFWRGVTKYRYDADELAEAYHSENQSMEDIGPDSERHFDPVGDYNEWEFPENVLEGETQRPVATAD